MICVQFSDDKQTEIVSYFGAPQDPDDFPDQGEITTTDARWKAYYDKQSPVAQAALPKPE